MLKLISLKGSFTRTVSIQTGIDTITVRFIERVNYSTSSVFIEFFLVEIPFLEGGTPRDKEVKDCKIRLQ